ncbi:hypothetical protein [Streptomyces sp. NPDC054834]
MANSTSPSPSSPTTSGWVTVEAPAASDTPDLTKRLKPAKG